MNVKFLRNKTYGKNLDSHPNSKVFIIFCYLDTRYRFFAPAFGKLRCRKVDVYWLKIVIIIFAFFVSQMLREVGGLLSFYKALT